MSTQKTRFPVKKIALSAVFVALYVVVSMTLSVTFFNSIKITFEALPVMICAVLFGPAYAGIVGGLGEFLNQMLTYGLTPTTVLWVLPSVVRGVFIGLCMMLLKKKSQTTGNMFDGKKIVAFYIICLISGILVSCLNTFTLYVDSNMFGYYSYAMVFGAFWVRIGTGLICSTLMATATVPIVTAMKKARIIS